jgi:hypothetical protein
MSATIPDREKLARLAIGMMDYSPEQIAEFQTFVVIIEDLKNRYGGDCPETRRELSREFERLSPEVRMAVKDMFGACGISMDVLP